MTWTIVVLEGVVHAGREGGRLSDAPCGAYPSNWGLMAAKKTVVQEGPFASSFPRA